jgi:hypothetical protein
VPTRPRADTAALNAHNRVPTAKMMEASNTGPSITAPPRIVDRSLRSYSKKNRVYILREFLLETYGNYLSVGDTVLDVAGGKGDLSWLLHNIDGFKSVVVDPRRTKDHIEKSVEYLRLHPDECRKRADRDKSTYQPIAALLPKLEEKNYEIASPAHLRIFSNQSLVDAIQNVLNQQDESLEAWKKYWDRAFQETEGFVTPTGKNDFSLEPEAEATNAISDAKAALEMILNAKLIVGFHPDQATDYCFLLAKVLKIPVCVVPCCTFPSEFPDRRLYHEGEGYLVQRYEDLIQYILQENDDVEFTNLSFPGTATARKTVMYTLP